MSFKLDIPFYIFSLQFADGVQVRFPMTDNEAFQLGQSKEFINKKFADLFQTKVLDKGEMLDLLDELNKGDFHKNSISIHFSAAEDGISFPNLELVFDYFYNPQEKGIWGVLPVLGLEAFGENAEDLKTSLEEVVKLEFLKKRRLNVVQNILESIWFSEVEMTNQQLSFEVPTPAELQQNKTLKKDTYLPKAARLLNINKPVLFGFEAELQQLIKSVKNNYSKNVLLTGPPGVGKTTMVWELARQIKKQRIKGQIWESTASLLIKELMTQQGWKANLVHLSKELSTGEDFLFVRNLKELFEVGKHESNSISIAAYMQSFIAKGQISLISECTDDEFAQIDLENPGFLSLFHVIRLEQPVGEPLESIIFNKVQSIAKSNKVSLEKPAIQEIIRLTKRFSPYEGMPGTAIQFLERLILKKVHTDLPSKTILPEEVIQHFCAESGLPVFMLDSDIPMDIEEIDRYFNQNIFGQKNAIDAVLDVLASVKMGLSKNDKPIASLLFVGPTGVGKTELAKTLTSFMLGNKERMVRFDMSEYANPYAVSRLSGSAGEEGLLSATVRKNPFCVLLFDEIEKADTAFFDLLLQILSEGRLTDGTGKLVNFCSTIILMTSNIGASAMSRSTMQLGRKNEEGEETEYFENEVRKFFRPELYNRIDKILAFRSLGKENIRYIVNREIDSFLEREGIKYRKLKMEIKPDVLDYLGKKGYDKQYGARFLQRIIREELIIPIARALNSLEADEQLMLKVFLDNNQIKTRIETDPLGFDLLIEELEISNYANYASSLRRDVHNLRIGHLFVQFLSELEMMEPLFTGNKKEQKGWKDAQLAKKYTDYYACRENIKELAEEIEDYELQLSLSSLNLSESRPDFQDKIKDWSKRFFAFKKRLISLLKPEINVCYFSIYGQQIETIALFYLKIYKRLNFAVTAQAVWFREKYYFEERVDKAEPGRVGARKAAQKEYIKSKLPANFTKNDFVPPHKNDVLVGIEYVISGDCAFLQLKSEQSVQHWKFSTNEDQIFILEAAVKSSKTPENIHRKDFYRQKSITRKIDAFDKNQLLVLNGKSSLSSSLLEPWLFDFMKKKLAEELEKIMR